MKVELEIPDRTFKQIEAVAKSISQTPSEIVAQVLYDRFINYPVYHPAHVTYADSDRARGEK
jgi:hypothetical protein